MLTKLEQGLGYTFRNKALLENALTHSSYANENRERHLPDNERLEFLGDSILGFVVAEYLYRNFPDKPFREMPWGEMYIQPYTGRVLTRAAFTFGTKVAKFAAACEKMGAIRLPHGDAGYQFDFLGGYRMQIMVYAGDDEFPPSAQVLYSDNFESGFAAEDRVVAGDLLITAIKKEL